jgi:hypothetical protein
MWTQRREGFGRTEILRNKQKWGQHEPKAHGAEHDDAKQNDQVETLAIK